MRYIDNEKRYIPGTNPDWDLELPDGYVNSFTNKYGKPYDNGHNFDERDDDDDDEEGKDKDGGNK